MTNVEKLIALFGGEKKEFAGIIGRDPAVVSRLLSTGKRGQGGKLPTVFNHVVVEAARARGLDMQAVGACLDPHVCPTCKRPLEPGVRPS